MYLFHWASSTVLDSCCNCLQTVAVCSEQHSDGEGLNKSEWCKTRQEPHSSTNGWIRYRSFFHVRPSSSLLPQNSALLRQLAVGQWLKVHQSWISPGLLPPSQQIHWWQLFWCKEAGVKGPQSLEMLIILQDNVIIIRKYSSMKNISLH